MANGRLVQLLIHTGNYLWCVILEHYIVMLLMLLKWTSFQALLKSKHGSYPSLTVKSAPLLCHFQAKRGLGSAAPIADRTIA